MPPANDNDVLRKALDIEYALTKTPATRTGMLDGKGYHGVFGVLEFRGREIRYDRIVYRRPKLVRLRYSIEGQTFASMRELAIYLAQLRWEVGDSDGRPD